MSGARWSAVLAAAGLAACAAPPDSSPLDASTRAAVRVDGPGDRLERATALFAAGRFDESAALTEALLEHDPDDPRTEAALLLAAESRYRAGDFERALAGFVRLRDDFPTTRAHAVLPERFFVIGEALATRPKRLLGGLVEDRRPGIDALSRLVVHYPENPRADDAWMLLGAAHRADGASDLAAEAYRRLLRTYPESPLREDAAWQLVETYREKWKGPEYDPSPLDAALAALARYRSEFGDSAAVQDVARELAESRAGHARTVQEYYRDRGDAPTGRR